MKAPFALLPFVFASSILAFAYPPAGADLAAASAGTADAQYADDNGYASDDEEDYIPWLVSQEEDTINSILNRLLSINNNDNNYNVNRNPPAEEAEDEDENPFDKLFETIEKSWQSQFSNVKSHLGQVRAFREELEEQFEKRLVDLEESGLLGLRPPVFHVGEFMEEFQGVHWPVLGLEGMRRESTEGRRKGMGGEGKRRVVGGDVGKKERVEKVKKVDLGDWEVGVAGDMDFERAGLWGLEGWDVNTWFETEDYETLFSLSDIKLPLIINNDDESPLGESLILEGDKLMAAPASEWSFSNFKEIGNFKKDPSDNSKTVLELIKGSDHAASFYGYLKDFPDLMERLNSTEHNTTIFVPNNGAFRRMLHKKKNHNKSKGDDDKIPKECIEAILTYHTLSGNHTTDSIKWYNTLESNLPAKLLGEEEHQRLRLGYKHRDSKKLTINLKSTVVMPNIYAKNGVIHAVDNVILPPPDIKILMQLFPAKFSTTMFALAKTGLLDVLEKGPNTVFAPSNSAWEKIPPAITAFLFSERGKKYLEVVMKYHIVPKQVLYSDAMLRPMASDGDHSHRLDGGYSHLELETLLTKDTEAKNSGVLHVDIVRYPKLLDFRVNGRNEIVLSNGLAKDGVIHVPNHVFMPTCEELHKSDISGSIAMAHAGAGQAVLRDDSQRERGACINSKKGIEEMELGEFVEAWDGFMRRAGL